MDPYRTDSPKHRGTWHRLAKARRGKEQTGYGEAKIRIAKAENGVDEHRQRMAERGYDSMGKGVAMSRYEPQENGSVELGYEMQKKSTERRRNAMELLSTDMTGFAKD